MSDPFASAAEFLQYGGIGPQDDLARVQQHLDLASSIIRRFTDQTLSVVVDDVVELEGVSRTTLILPERPVTAVSSVVVDGVTLDPADYTFTSSGLLKRIIDWTTGATVTYTHGFPEGSDDYKAIKAICMDIAARSFTLNERGQGEAFGQELLESRGWAPAVFLLPNEQNLLMDFGKVWVG